MDISSLKETLELYFSCNNLIDRDTFSKSDPVVRVFVEYRNGQKDPIGTTETVKNNLNPVFKKAITIDYLFET